MSPSIRQQKNPHMTSASATDQMLSAFKAALARGSRGDVNASAARLLEARPALGAQWRSVAAVLMHNGEIAMALAAFQHFVEAAGNSPAARLEQGILYARAGRLVEASQILGAITGSSDPIGLTFARATVALDLGDFVQASELLEDVVLRRPSAGTAWLSLATIGALAAPDRRRALFDAVAHVSSSGVTDKVAWQYAVGRVLAEQGDVDKAFEAFTTGANLRRTVLPYDHAADRENARQAAAEMVQEVAAPTDGGMVPILVAGLPRSGTTLVEQILASHSAVAGGGEVNVLRLVAQDRRELAPLAPADRSRAMTDLYRHLLVERFGSDGRIIDKSLNLSRFIGLAATMSADIPIVWVRRDPLDCAWSCFRSHFVVGAEWSLTLPDMARHFRLEDQLHHHWLTKLGGRILQVQYEALVDDPAYWTRTILSHCGLADERDPYQPHLKHRAVTTSSVAQVRRPINRDGIGGAGPYRKHLEPFARHYF